MKLRVGFIWIVLFVGCGPEPARNDGSSGGSDISKFNLQSPESGYFGYWQRTADTSKSQRFLTIDRTVVLHTAVCRFPDKTERVTVASKIELTDDGLMTVKDNRYDEAYNEGANEFCQSKIRAGEYRLKVASGENGLTIEEDGQDPMQFVRTSRNKILQ